MTTILPLAILARSARVARAGCRFPFAPAGTGLRMVPYCAATQSSGTKLYPALSRTT
ncbi:hypothetical protein GCM10007888_12550 [Methylobacterium oxalidis]|uniref:Uncharacterized protein n=1 Tax=Methylobacterium oxalidis TaxID=944322 RepID=A0ABQ6DJ67_9HYPH|nr:hypothetical protein GCM10007888_12550 [Methylobacterium oxalidis]